MARQAWKRFEASLRTDVAHDTADESYLHDWDFMYWHRIGLRTAELSIVCSGVWLMSRLIYL
jgi:hypothetical protein